MTLVQERSHCESGPRTGLEDGMLGSILDEYLQEVHTADYRSFRGASTPRIAVEGFVGDPDRNSEALEADEKVAPATRPRHRPALQQDWTPSDGSEDSSPRQKRSAAARKKGQQHRGGRLSSRRTQELQEKNRQAQQRFRQRQREKVTELEDHVVDLNTRIEQLLKDNAELENRVGERSPGGRSRGDSGQLSSDQIASPKQEGALDERNFQDDIILTVRPDTQTVLSPAQLRELSVTDLVEIWKEYREELTRHVNAADSDANAASNERIKQLVYELMVLLMRVAVHNPLVTKSFVAGNMEQIGSFDAEDMQMWRDVMVLLQLDCEQKRKMVELRQFFLVKLRTILDQRKLIHADITDSLPEAYSARHAARQFLKGHQSLEHLKENMREEHVLKLDWISTIFNHIWTPLQTARCLVLSWPYTPDTFAITSWVAAEQGDTTALSVCTPNSSADTQSGASLPTQLKAERNHSEPGLCSPTSPHFPPQTQLQGQPSRTTSPSDTNPRSHSHPPTHQQHHQPTQPSHMETSRQTSVDPPAKPAALSNSFATANPPFLPHPGYSMQQHPQGVDSRLEQGAIEPMQDLMGNDSFLLPLPNPQGFSFPPDVTLPPGIFPPLHVHSPLLMPSVHGISRAAQSHRRCAPSHMSEGPTQSSVPAHGFSGSPFASQAQLSPHRSGR